MLQRHPGDGGRAAEAKASPSRPLHLHNGPAARFPGPLLVRVRVLVCSCARVRARARVLAWCRCLVRACAFFVRVRARGRMCVKIYHRSLPFIIDVRIEPAVGLS